MNGDSVLTTILLCFLAYGFYCGWKQLTNGYGIIGGHLSTKTLGWVNQKKAAPIVTKICISFVLAYILATIKILAVFFSIIGHISR